MTTQLCVAVSQALASGEVEEVNGQLAELAQAPDLPAYFQPLIPALRAILGGSRDPALASDPGLNYRDAAEVLLLLEGRDPP